MKYLHVFLEERGSIVKIGEKGTAAALEKHTKGGILPREGSCRVVSISTTISLNVQAEGLKKV